jgi:hypothetical protein
MRRPGYLAGADYWFGGINRFTQASSFVHPLARVGFNPQPEPPGRTASRFVHPLARVGFNPQPEPPGRITAMFGF